MKDLLINFHGFLSSHKSDNAVEFRREVISKHGEVESLSPCLPDNPEARVIVIEELIRESLKFHRTIGLVGYSLGGSFSTFT
ncbi:MAG: hypothetical protein KJO81_05315 [Gammaproteobacteria bacterium]|nr:hypothetical protein [Gammaproteobacteria bacterium]